jgi:hypothetical protein
MKVVYLKCQPGCRIVGWRCAVVTGVPQSAKRGRRGQKPKDWKQHRPRPSETLLRLSAEEYHTTTCDTLGDLLESPRSPEVVEHGNVNAEERRHVERVAHDLCERPREEHGGEEGVGVGLRGDQHRTEYGMRIEGPLLRDSFPRLHWPVS